MFGIDFCDVEMKSRYYLAFFLEDIHIICSYARRYRLKWQKISEKDVVYFQPEDNH